MAITNQQIILMYKVENNIPIETPLYTFAAWKIHGRQVKKGEKARHTLDMWRYINKKKKGEDGKMRETDDGYCYVKKMYLFEADQTEEIKKK